MIHRARVFLIELGKMLPFIVCFIVLISYAEDLFALVTNNFAVYDGSYVLNKPLSWWIGQYFEYNLITVVILLTISVAIETCVWNKICILYLSLQLMEKSYFIDVELYPEQIYIIVIANIIVSAYLVYKGFSILLKKH